MSLGYWDTERSAVVLTQARGADLAMIGRYDPAVGAQLLRPEEALYLMDKGCLEVYHDDVPLSFQAAAGLMLSDEFGLTHYTVSEASALSMVCPP